MRNLKRALSLLLSSTMVLGMLVMGSSAASYQDVDASNKNQEAIEVLKAVGIMEGIDTAGNFGPDQSVTRNQMAVIMAHLLNLDYDYYRGTNTFTDVPEWAAPYVAACVAEGVTAGIGNGLYGGENKVTAAQASLMIMKALGYFQYQEDFGTDWQVATIRQASYINMFDNIDATAETALSRAQVAQLVLNGLKSNMVTFTGDVGTEVTIGDTTINSGYRAEYTAKTNANSKYNSIDVGTTNIAQNDQYYVQLGEELYNGKLKLSNSGSDDFERPSRVWSYDGQEIGTYAKKELIVETYTAGVTGKELYNLLSSATINDYDLASYVDGKANTIKKSDLVRSNNDDLAATGNGVVTEVYVDNQAKEITIVSVNNYLAKATSNYSKEKEYAPLNVYKSANGINYNVDVEEVAEVANVTEDTFYQVNISYKNNSTVGEVVAISDVKVLSNSTVTKFSTSSSQVSKLTVDGTEYKANEKAFYDADVLNTYNDGLLTNNTYNVYLDSNGYFLGVDLYSGESNYVFITGYDLNGSNLYVKTAEAGAIFLDGTMKTVKVNVTDTNKNIQNALVEAKDNYRYFATWTAGNATSELNEWYTYVENADGTYTLKPAVRMTWTKYPSGTEVIRTDNLSILDTQGNRDRVYGEDGTVFLTVDTDAVSNTTYRGITEVTGVYTGVQNVDIEIDTTSADALRMGQIFTVYDKDWYVIGAVVLGDAMGAQQNLAYILSGAKSEAYKEGTYYWEFDAFMGDSIKTFTAKSKYPSSSILVPNSVQELRFDGEYVTDIKNLTDNNTTTDDFYENAEWGNKIDGEAVYKMTGLVKASNVINLQGRTMYITANRSDLGLALAANAKAVVIQDENGKSNVKTEFSSVSSAVAYLADADTTTSGVLEYEGNIYAVLDSKGVAQWVVFDSSTELKTGAQDPNYNKNGNVKTIYAAQVELDPDSDSTNVLVLNGSSAKASYTINEFGMMTATLEYTAPQWVPAGATVNLTVPVNYFGVSTGINATFSGAVGANGKATLYWNSAAFAFYSYTDRSKLTLGDATLETFGAVNVYWFDQNGDRLEDTLVNETTKMVTGATAPIAAKLANSSSGNATLNSTGLTSDFSSSSVAYSSLNTGWSNSTKQASGTAPVVLVLDISNRADTYTVTAISATTLGTLYSSTPAAYASKKLTVTASRTSGIAANGSVTLTASLDSAIAKTNEALKVTLSTGTELYFKNDAATTAATVVNGSLTVNSNVTITVTKVETIAGPTVDRVTWKDVNGDGVWSVNDTFTLYFSGAVHAAPTLTKSGGVVVGAGVLAGDKMSATYTITTAPTGATDKVAIAAGAMTFADQIAGNTQAYEITISNAAGAADAGLTLTKV